MISSNNVAAGAVWRFSAVLPWFYDLEASSLIFCSLRSGPLKKTQPKFNKDRVLVPVLMGLLIRTGY